jgi:hypothetical protein
VWPPTVTLVAFASLSVPPLVSQKVLPETGMSFFFGD